MSREEDASARAEMKQTEVTAPVDPTLAKKQSVKAQEDALHNFFGDQETTDNADDQFADPDEAAHAAEMQTRIFPTFDSSYKNPELRAFRGKKFVWAYTKQAHTFGSCPIEIRNEIYRLCLITHVEIIPYPETHEQETYVSVKAQFPSPALLAVNSTYSQLKDQDLEDKECLYPSTVLKDWKNANVKFSVISM